MRREIPLMSEGGLTSQEVFQRQQDGRINHCKTTVKPLHRIIADHLFTLFNAVNALLATALCFVGSYHNLPFLGVAVCNTALGIAQEIRCRSALKKLSLHCAVNARVRRDDVEKTIPFDDIVEGDRLILCSGDTIGVDAVLQSGMLETDESLLTGESVAVLKTVGDELLSGSMVISGNGEAIAARVGNRAYAAQLCAQARCYKRPPSRLTADIHAILRFACLCMIPLAVFLLVRQRALSVFNMRDTVTAIVAALLGMMPQGLLLLTAAALMIGAIRLADKRVLVQDLYSTETLARISLLCMDKTGTLTNGRLSVCRVIPLSEQWSETLLGTAVAAIGDNNATACALRERFPKNTASTVIDRMPFSSHRQYSAVSLQGVGTVVIGAPERLLSADILTSERSTFTRDGYRLVAVCLRCEPAPQLLTPLALLVLEDELRTHVRETISRFQNEGVPIRVLSGDHPDTVAAIAVQAGIHYADRAVDASLLDADGLEDAAKRYVIFGRVNPDQKRDLIRCFKQQGHTVGMVGDGVNDIPAFKEADCSVAMATGSAASRQTARLVLSDGDFAALPVAWMQGRRIVNNITRSASLFLVKTVMSFLLTLCAIVLPMSYPFEPLQLTLIGAFAQSIPAFFLTLEADTARVRGRFLHTVLRNAVPSAVIITAFVLLIRQYLAPLLRLTAAQSSTLCVYVTGAVWLILLYRLCHPFTPARRWLCLLMTVGFFSATLLSALFVPSVSVLPTAPMWGVFATLALLALTLDHLLFRLTKVSSDTMPA